MNKKTIITNEEWIIVKRSITGAKPLEAEIDSVWIEFEVYSLPNNISRATIARVRGENPVDTIRRWIEDILEDE